MRSAFSSRRRRRLAAGLALVLVVAVVVGVVLSAGSGAPKPASSARSTSGATTVERRDLVETDTESGTLGYANPQTVYDRLSGTITWLPSVGQVIEPGQTLFEVDSEPVILMNGTRPAYRDLSASDTAGQDILQLNRNLVALGFDPAGIVIDDEWQAATTAGVDLLQASLGETETGSLALGNVVFLPGDQLISTVDATVGSTGGSAGGPSSSANASTPAAAASAEFVGLTSTAGSRDSTTATSTSASPTTTSTTAPTTNPEKTKTSKPTSVRKPTSSSSSQALQGLTALLKAEAAQLKAATAALKAATAALKAAKSSTSSSAHSSSSKGSSSSSKSSSSSSSGSGGSASAILQTTSTQLIVTVDLDATKQSEAKVGENVTVEMPAGNTVDGEITAVSSVAQSSSSASAGGTSGGSSSSSTVPVTIKLKGHHSGAGLDQASVSVNFAEAKARNVLSVQVTALLATSGGGYAVQEAASPYKLIPVTTGLFAAGYVQISGSGVHPGLQVTNSQG
jgi:multidrug efflux system membrane fusion protein